MCKNIALNVNINGTYPYLYFCDNLEEDYGAVSGNETFPDFQSYEIKATDHFLSRKFYKKI